MILRKGRVRWRDVRSSSFHLEKPRADITAERRWFTLKMQNSTASPESNTTSPSIITKSKEQILIQSSGAMIAVIVIGIIVLLTILLFILKTYNKRTHPSRLLGSNGGSKPQKKTSQPTVPIIPMGQVGSVSGNTPYSNSDSSSWTRTELNSADRIEEMSTATAVSVHDTSGNT
ncbi:noncompact myelin-associated protein [Syngnathus typhle]|uniref:noncompact myelin-associated protein n=1 Tax=Syngnathus typhle TaxID=161592 RepID=UPI002A69C4B6|nr:noncompact myelin-associated protein [Syngnathus typhle]